MRAEPCAECGDMIRAPVVRPDGRYVCEACACPVVHGLGGGGDEADDDTGDAPTDSPSWLAVVRVAEAGGRVRA
jgi:hypothetical protein